MCCSSYGLSSHNCNSILTNKFSLIKATKLYKCLPNFAIAFNALSISMVMSAVQICISTAFSLVPINVFICSSCFISLKNISICQRLLYSSAMVLASHLKLLVISSIVCLFSSSHMAILRNCFGTCLLSYGF